MLNRRHFSLFSTSALVSGALLASPAHALPTGGTVAQGTAFIGSVTNEVGVDQRTDKAIINWQSFNAVNGERTRFMQPSARSITLNRDLSGTRTVYDGELLANGRVFIVNPKGILFGSNARVDVGGLVASTANISDSNFMAGNFRFDQPGDATASVINRGRITAADGGIAALVGPGVANSGVITANYGKVALGAANTATIDFTGDGLINFAVGQQAGKTALDENGRALGAAIINSGSLNANGGVVQMSANTARGVLDEAIQLGGTVSALTSGAKTGTVIIDNNGGQAKVSGTVDVSGKAAGQKGGIASFFSPVLQFLSGSKVDATGAAGGGTVNTSTKTTGPAVFRQGVTADPGSVIDASALNNGKGGTLNFDVEGGYPWLRGQIAARGGANGGDGGDMNVRLHNMDFQFQTLPDLTASNGKGGNLSFKSLNDKTSAMTGYGLSNDQLKSLLNNGTNVSFDNAYKITQNGLVDWNGAGNLKLKAQEVTIGQYIPSAIESNGKGGIEIETNRLVLEKSKLSTNEGDLKIKTGTFDIIRNSNDDASAGAYAKSGNVIIEAANGISATAPLINGPIYGVVGSETGRTLVTIGAGPIVWQGTPLVNTIRALRDGAGEKKILLQDGTYRAPLVNRSNLTIQGINGPSGAKITGGVMVNADNVTLSGLDIAAEENGIGVNVFRSNNGALLNSHVHGGQVGVLSNARDYTVSGNRFDVAGTAIAINDTSKYTVSGNTIVGATSGIHTQNAAGTISGNTLTDTKEIAIAVRGMGIDGDTGTALNTTVENNTIDKALNGISNLASNHAIIRGNTINNTAGDAIFSQDNLGTSILSNKVSKSSGVGIVGLQSAGLRADSNEVTTARTGAIVAGSSNVRVSNNRISDVELTGILVADAADGQASVTNNTVHDVKSGTGIAVRGMRDAVVANNDVSLVWGTQAVGGAGISVDSSPRALIADNKVKQIVGNGIEVIGSADTEVTRNTLTQIFQQPIVTVDSPNAHVHDNTF